MHFDRFDICEAYYMYATHYHEGQYSNIYKIFGRLNEMDFRPSPLLSTEKALTENGLEIYNSLIKHKYLQKEYHENI